MNHLTDAAGELYGTRPEEFVAARTALVKRLRAAKARDAAAEVASWRRPSVADWGLNLAARSGGPALTDFLAAAASARRAQADALAGAVGGGTALRGAVAELRLAAEAFRLAAEEQLVADGRPAGGQLGPLAARLTEVAASPELGAQLQAGCLGSGSTVLVDLFGGAAGPTSPDAFAPDGSTVDPGSGSTRRGRRAGARASRRSPVADDAAERAARRQALDHDVAAARSAEEQARTVREAASARAARADEAVSAASAREDEARTALAAAEEDRRRAEADHDAARQAADEATLASERALAALDAALARLADVDGADPDGP